MPAPNCSRGGLAALYRGLTPSLLGLIHVAVQFPLYEALKRSWDFFSTSMYLP